MRVLALVMDVATSSTLTAVLAATSVLRWWADAARIGSSVTSVMAMAEGAAILAAIELVGAAALYTLHRLLRAEGGWHPPGPLCV